MAGAARDHHRLPVSTYSPELNLCEMVFGYVKNSLRISRNSNNAFFDEINERFHQIMCARMERFYTALTNKIMRIMENENNKENEENKDFDANIKGGNLNATSSTYFAPSPQ